MEHVSKLSLDLTKAVDVDDNIFLLIEMESKPLVVLKFFINGGYVI